MMPDYLDLVRNLLLAMSMMKTKAVISPDRHRIEPSAQLPVMIAGDQYDGGASIELVNQLRQPRHTGSVMNQIAQQDKCFRFVIAQQLIETRLNCLHTPQRKQTARGALAQFEAEMEIGNNQPFLSPVKQREAAIKYNVLSDIYL